MIKPEPCRVKVDGCDARGMEVAGKTSNRFSQKNRHPIVKWLPHLHKCTGPPHDGGCIRGRHFRSGLRFFWEISLNDCAEKNGDRVFRSGNRIRQVNGHGG